MSITRLTTNGLTGTKYDIASADNYYMEPIATTLLGTATGTVTFSNIPQNYKHLQIRASGRVAGTSSFDILKYRFNSDSGSNYTGHSLYGDGSSAAATSATSQTYGWFGRTSLPRDGVTASVFGGTVIDILDYSNVYKFKTTRSLAGADANGSGFVELTSSVWLNSGAITQIDIYDEFLNNFLANSRFSLFGIKG